MNDGQADLKAQLKQVVIMLNKMERTYASERSKAITELQNKIWDEFDLQNEELYFLQDFAGDLNFYEPMEKDRDATLGYKNRGLSCRPINSSFVLTPPSPTSTEFSSPNSFG